MIHQMRGHKRGCKNVYLMNSKKATGRALIRAWIAGASYGLREDLMAHQMRVVIGPH